VTWSATLALAGAGGEPVDLWRTVMSHGVADLPPNRIDEEARTLETTVAVPRGRPQTVIVREGRDGKAALSGSAGKRSEAVLDGVRHIDGIVRTESIVLRTKSGTVRRVIAEHQAEKWL